jgi:hypothetical protein
MLKLVAFQPGTLFSSILLYAAFIPLAADAFKNFHEDFQVRKKFSQVKKIFF